MADERVFIVCKFCAKAHMLYKTYGGNVGLSDEVAGWIGEHLLSCHPFGAWDMCGEPGFTLMCERAWWRHKCTVIKKAEGE